MISVLLPPEDLKTHKNAGSVALVKCFRGLNFCEKIKFVLILILFLFNDESVITKK